LLKTIITTLAYIFYMLYFYLSRWSWSWPDWRRCLAM